MAPFFSLDIINRFLSGLPHLNDIHILTNEELNGQLQNHLPSIISDASEICRGLIGDDYLESTMVDKAFSENTIYDAAVLLEHGDETPIAFLIVEKGECKTMKALWSVNLICAKEESKKGKKGLGQILMGLYLFTIHHNDLINASDKKGILELANGYVNAAGLASYAKLGFEINESLWGPRCFQDYGNLPMLAENINPTKIIDILNGRDTGYSKPKICSIRGDMQLYLGLCKNLFIFMFHAPTIEQGDYIIDDYQLADKRIINYELLKTHIMRKYEEENPEPVVVGRRSTRNRSPNALSPKTKLKTWLERFIDTIEKNYETIDASQLPGYTNLHTIQDRKKIVTPAPARTEEKPVIQNIKTRLRNAFNVVPTPTRQSSKKRKRGGRRLRKTMRK
jgi:hypothetical protein